MRYPIGDVARTLGLTTAGLHYFEREGVIEPRKAGGTRRFYDAEDIIRLISYKKYRSMQLPLKEIVHQFSAEGETVEGIMQKLASQREEISILAQQYEAIASDILWFEEGIRRVESQMDQIDVCIMPECYALTVGTDGLISRNKEDQTLVSHWLDCMPAIRLSVFSQDEQHACFGYTVSAQRARQLHLDQSPGVAYFPSSVALHICRKMSRAYFESAQLAFEPLWNHMRQRGFQQAGTAMGVNFCVECTDGRRDTLCELWLPIK